MAYFDLGQDILANYLRRSGELFPTSTTLADADRLIDAKLYCTSGYWDFSAWKPWRWARLDPAIQVRSVAKQSVTVSTISGATVTLSATIATSQAGRKFYLDGESIPHRRLTPAHPGRENVYDNDGLATRWRLGAGRDAGDA